MNRIHTETATKDDLDAVMEIEALSFGADRFSRRQFAYLIGRSKGAFRVIRKNGKAVAYISLLASSRTCNLRIYAIAVHPEERGKGVGRRLLEEAAAYALRTGKNRITLEVRTTNLPALALYEKEGFVRTGIRYGYYPDGADAYRLERPAGNP